MNLRKYKEINPNAKRFTNELEAIAEFWNGRDQRIVELATSAAAWYIVKWMRPKTVLERIVHPFA